MHVKGLAESQAAGKGSVMAIIIMVISYYFIDYITIRIVVSISMPPFGNRDLATAEQLGCWLHAQYLYQSKERAAGKQRRTQHPL